MKKVISSLVIGGMCLSSQSFGVLSTLDKKGSSASNLVSVEKGKPSKQMGKIGKRSTNSSSKVKKSNKQMKKSTENKKNSSKQVKSPYKKKSVSFGEKLQSFRRKARVKAEMVLTDPDFLPFIGTTLLVGGTIAYFTVPGAKNLFGKEAVVADPSSWKRGLNAVVSHPVISVGAALGTVSVVFYSIKKVRSKSGSSASNTPSSNVNPATSTQQKQGNGTQGTSNPTDPNRASGSNSSSNIPNANNNSINSEDDVEAVLKKLEGNEKLSGNEFELLKKAKKDDNIAVVADMIEVVCNGKYYLIDRNDIDGSISAQLIKEDDMINNMRFTKVGLKWLKEAHSAKEVKENGEWRIEIGNESFYIKSQSEPERKVFFLEKIKEEQPSNSGPELEAQKINNSVNQDADGAPGTSGGESPSKVDNNNRETPQDNKTETSQDGASEFSEEEPLSEVEDSNQETPQDNKTDTSQDGAPEISEEESPSKGEIPVVVSPLSNQNDGPKGEGSRSEVDNNSSEINNPHKTLEQQ